MTKFKWFLFLKFIPNLVKQESFLSVIRLGRTMKAMKIQSMVIWSQPLKNSRLVYTLHVIWTIRSLFSKIKPTNQPTPPKTSFSNRNKLAVILSTNLQLYNHYKYMIIFIKMQKQTHQKNPTLKSERNQEPLTLVGSNLSSQQRAHMPQQELALARHHPNSLRTKPDQNLHTGRGGGNHLWAALMNRVCSL